MIQPRLSLRVMAHQNERYTIFALSCDLLLIAKAKDGLLWSMV